MDRSITKAQLMVLININKEGAPPGTKIPKQSAKKDVLITFMWKTLGVIHYNHFD